MHEHFNAAGKKTGHTIITRESMWDDESRGRALRLAEYEDSLCTCGCNQPMRIAHDKKRLFRVEEFKCAAGRALTIHKRNEAEKHKKDKKPGWDDGLHYLVVPHDE